MTFTLLNVQHCHECGEDRPFTRGTFWDTCAACGRRHEFDGIPMSKVRRPR